VTSARAARRFSQVAAFALFVVLFLETEYRGDDQLSWAVNVFLRLDPLVALAATAAARTVIALVWPALVTAALTAVLGRAFCGWVCPMGTVLDAADASVFRRRVRPAAVPPGRRRWKHLILFFVLASALFGLQWFFLVDPLSLLVRSLAVSVFPALNAAAHGLFGALWRLDVRAVTVVSEPVYGFLKGHVLAFRQPVFYSSVLVGVLFLGVVALERVERRFWCRNLCPLGALLGLLGRAALVRRRVAEAACTRCGLCEAACRMRAIPGAILPTEAGECVACMDCQAVCPEKAIRFTGRGGVPPSAAADPGRRLVLASAAFGALSVPFFRVGGHLRAPDPFLVRPPGALPEEEFLARCTRCGECMRVCIANGLQPAFLEAGPEGLWSPRFVMRIGYCEYNCTLCGQVCPTGAIRRLSRREKQAVRIGLADIDRSRCLPWKGEAECLVCEEHCPTPQKAIVMRPEPARAPSGESRVLKKPYVVETLCIGCGICETKCPVAGRSAVVVTARGESRAAAGAVL